MNVDLTICNDITEYVENDFCEGACFENVPIEDALNIATFSLSQGKSIVLSPVDKAGEVNG